MTLRTLRKLMLASIAVLALAGDAFADPRMDQLALKLFLYHNDCAPLSGRLLDMMQTMLRAMDERERVRAMMEVSIVVGGHKDEFCKAMEPAIEQITK